MFIYNMFNLSSITQRLFSRELTEYTVVFNSAPRGLSNFRTVLAESEADAKVRLFDLPNTSNITEITDCFPTIRN